METRIAAILEDFSFHEVILPIIDYADAYAATGAVDARQSYRFIDRDGELVTIRSDFTPMVARVLAPELTQEQLPLRVYYRGDVIRNENPKIGAAREMFQLGGEIVGDPSVEADIEVLSLVSRIVREMSSDPIIVFTDVAIPELIADTAREWLATKRAPEDAPGIVARLLGGIATTADLPAAIGKRLDAIAAACPECVMHLDDVDRVRGYYTGLRFRAYDGKSRRILAQGGRYDNLYEKFGASAPAVGFTITCE